MRALQAALEETERMLTGSDTDERQSASGYDGSGNISGTGGKRSVSSQLVNVSTRWAE